MVNCCMQGHYYLAADLLHAGALLPSSRLTASFSAKLSLRMLQVKAELHSTLATCCMLVGVTSHLSNVNFCTTLQIKYYIPADRDPPPLHMHA